MGRHSLREGRSSSTGFFRRRQSDDLFERSFRSCHGCGSDVYVLSEDCRRCGRYLGLRAG